MAGGLATALGLVMRLMGMPYSSGLMTAFAIVPQANVDTTNMILFCKLENN